MKKFWKINTGKSYILKQHLSYISCFFVLSCLIFSACIDQGGQSSFFLQLVKIPLFTSNIPSLIEETPFNLGSFSELSKISL